MASEGQDPHGMNAVDAPGTVEDGADAALLQDLSPAGDEQQMDGGAQEAGQQEAPEQPAAATAAAAIPLQQVLSLPGARRNGVVAMDAEHLLLAVGPGCMLLDMHTGQQRYLPGRPGTTVGALARHPCGRWFAVGEKCRHGTPRM